MQRLLPPILFALAATVFSLPAAPADEKDRDRSHTGTGASSEGGASLGGTGIDSGVSNQRGTPDSDRRIKLQKRPKPAEEPKDQDEEFRKKQDAERRK